jgi:hypothetical protein
LSDLLAAADKAEKACTRCGEVKPLAEYAADKRASTGTQSVCKKCQADIRRGRRDKDREAQKRWREKNAEYVCAKRKEYDQKTKPKRRQKERARYWKDPDKARKKAEEYRTDKYEDVMRRNREHLKEDRENLGPVYVAKVLGMRRKEVPPQLLEMKKEQLTLRRLARQLRKAKNESSKDTDRITGQHGRGCHARRPPANCGEQPAGAGPQGNKRH